MSTDPNTIMSNAFPRPFAFTDVASAEHRAYQERHTASDATHATQLNDPRWIFAMRARLVLERQQVQIGQIEALKDLGHKSGLNPMQISSIIGTIERAIQRGGFDLIAHEEIMRVPECTGDGMQALTPRARWITFGVLFAWALSVAGIMQLVA
ncbi:MAG: hypothetical protein ACF8LL_14655 [Phycisphaerales bacterium]